MLLPQLGYQETKHSAGVAIWKTSASPRPASQVCDPAMAFQVTSVLYLTLATFPDLCTSSLGGLENLGTSRVWFQSGMTLCRSTMPAWASQYHQNFTITIEVIVHVRGVSIKRSCKSQNYHDYIKAINAAAI